MIKARFFLQVLLIAFLLSVFSLQVSGAAGDLSKTGEQAMEAANQKNASVKNPDIKSESAILIEQTRGQVLYQKQSSKRLPVPLVNKLMTALIAIEKCSPDASVTISKESASIEGAALNLLGGEKFTVEELLYALMLASANDAANSLAEYAGGNVQKFVQMMNSKACELNMKNTNFTNPTGLPDSMQYSTAYDAALLVNYALKNPVFRMYFSARAQPISGSGSARVLISQNTLFWSSDWVSGGKTDGSDKSAISSAIAGGKNNLNMISVIVNSSADKIAEESIRLFNYGFDNFKTGLLVTKGQSLRSMQVAGRNINLISLDDVYYTYPRGENYIKSVEFKVSGDIRLPLTKGQPLGKTRYILKDDTAIDVDLYSDVEIFPPENIVSKTIRKVTENRDILVLIIFLLFVEVCLIIYNISRAVKNRLSDR